MDRTYAPPMAQGPRVGAASAPVRREELVRRLSAGPPTGVVLVCAPAGSGKTTLVRLWLERAELDGRVAWVSVERGEQDAQRFWLSAIDALAAEFDEVQRVDPAPAFAGQPIVDQLLGNLTLLDAPAVLVIDDLHELASADAVQGLERFLARLPPLLRVVLITREDPRLGLHRLRLAGELIEVRGADLRFSVEEAEQLLRASGTTLSADKLERLHTRTEGWAAGLRLAAISLARHPDPARFVAEFSGSERTVAGYLLAEVLERQPPEVRDLLLRTSVLERVNGSLADRLTGRAGSERILQELEEANAFVSALDASRSWFRYHHLFADLLRLELRRVAPDAVASLHRAAAAWFAEAGDHVAAIRHAQAAGDFSLAAQWLFESRVALILDGRLATLDALLDGFPASFSATHPELALTRTGVLLREGRLEDAEACLTIAERAASEVPDDHRQLYELQVASVQLELARRRGDLIQAHRAMAALESALAAGGMGELERTSDIRALALLTLGATELWSLKLDEARERLETGLSLARRIHRPYLEIGCLAHLSILAPLAGRTAVDALELAREAIELAAEHGLTTDPVAAVAFAVGGGSLAFLGRLAEAGEWLARGERAIAPGVDAGTLLTLFHAQGLLASGEGRLDAAIAAFRRAEAIQATLAGEHALTVDVRAERQLRMISQGDHAPVRAELAALPAEERQRAEGRLAAGALALAEDEPQLAREELAPVLGGTVPALVSRWSAIYALLFDAAACRALSDDRAAEAALERALEIAEPEGVILFFLLTPVRELIESHPRHRSAHGAFLATIGDAMAGLAPRPAGSSEAVEELSEAELRVVRYLPSNLRAREMAAELMVSPNTVRTHLRHIYSKLGAHGRAEAVARARELGLLAPSLRRR